MIESEWLESADPESLIVHLWSTPIPFSPRKGA